MKKKKPSTPKSGGAGKPKAARSAVRLTEESFPVVGIGASAGGLEAFELFFKNMPPDSGMAFILIPHLDPAHTSMMPDLLKRFTQMKVLEAKDGVVVQPDEAYIIPPNKDMAIYHRTIQLTQPERTRGLRMPIDFFLRSLADDQGDKAICIILSGTGTDGSLGLRAVHGAGGMTMVQEAETAKYEGMPKSAMDTGLADFVLPVEKMPGQILAYAKKILKKQAVPVSPAEKAPSALQKVMMILRSQTGHDFSFYKKTTIHRRVEKRMDLHNIEDLTGYARYLHENPEEVQALFKELLIGVTSFFREPEAFEMFKRKYLPQILDDKPDGYNLRVWVPGCATGEEAYSLAMIIFEYIERHRRDIKLQVFGTDIDEEAIKTARGGFYLDNIAIDVSQDRIRRYFTKEEGGFRIKKDVRETVVFAAQNVVKDAPFTKLDLISCRNLLIYLEPELQNRLLSLFHYSLKPGGILFLGTSESIGRFTDLYTTLDKKWKIFQSKGAAAAQAAAILTGPWNYPAEKGEPEIKRLRKPSLSDLTQQVLLETFVPPSVVVSEKGEIHYIYGQTGRFLEPTQGHPNLNVLEMAREGLRIEARAALHGAVTKKKEMRYSGLKVRINGDYQEVNLSVRPLTGPEMDGLYLVAFQEVAPLRKVESKSKKKSAKISDRKAEELSQELAYTKESLQATIEELQAANEELRSTNEEFQSTNEELQSTNEELETSKEELQSVNEELVTVNSELQAKIDQQAKTEGDMKVLLDSTNIGTIFLDANLAIKRYTSMAVKVFSLIPTDVGRPLEDIRSNLKYEELLTDGRGVLENLQPLEKEVETKDGRWYLMRIMPSRSLENVIDGLVITFTDIVQFKRASADLTASQKQVADILDSICDGFFGLDKDWRITYLNTTAAKLMEGTLNGPAGKPISQVLATPNTLIRQLKEVRDSGTAREFTTVFPGTSVEVKIRAQPCREGLSVYFYRTGKTA